MNIRQQVLQELIELELFHTYQIINGKEVFTYELEGYDKEKIECEGSTWIVYVYDCINDYYHKNKKYFDSWTSECFQNAARSK
jgi:hypothetical protein